MSFYLQVRGNGATNIHPLNSGDNPGSCMAVDPLVMGIDSYLRPPVRVSESIIYESDVAICAQVHTKV